MEGNGVGSTRSATRQTYNGRPQTTLSDAQYAAFDAWLTALGHYRAGGPDGRTASALKDDVDRLWLAYERAVDEAQEPQ